MKRTTTVVLQTRERIGKVRVKIVTRQITLDHWIYICSWKLITTKAECICRDASFKSVLISQCFNEDNCYGAQYKFIFWLRFLILPSHRMAGTAAHFLTSSTKGTKDFLRKPKSCCWEIPQLPPKPTHSPTPSIPPKAVPGEGLLLVPTIPWRWAGISFHDGYSHTHPGHGQCEDTLRLASDTRLPDGLWGCRTGAVEKKERAKSARHHRPAMNWHQHALGLKDELQMRKPSPAKGWESITTHSPSLGCPTC